MYHSHSVLESMCRLSVASRRDASERLPLRTTVLVRNKMVTDVPFTTAAWTTVLICQVKGLQSLTDPFKGPQSRLAKDVLSGLTCPTRTGYGMSSLDDYGMATGRELIGSNHVL